MSCLLPGVLDCCNDDGEWRRLSFCLLLRLAAAVDRWGTENSERDLHRVQRLDDNRSLYAGGAVGE